MRLTLRTMLAYMDDILEPADREVIAQKIEDSEFARNLMRQIQESAQKSRLGAPKVNAKGLGLDANTVAEYLDNTLSGERVPDFERVCLESEMHLAEVAACHQVLTMVLGRPAEIDPAMKRRMYKIAERMAAAPVAQAEDIAVAPATDGAAPPAGEVQVAPPRHRPEVPAYLRERSTRSMWRTVLAAVVLLALLAGAITMALGPLDHRNPVLRTLGLAKAPPEEVARNNQPADKPTGEPTDADVKAATIPEPDGTGATTEPDSGTPPPDAGTVDTTTAPPMPEPMPPTPAPDAATSDSTPPAPEPRLEQPNSIPALPPNTGAPSLPSETTGRPEPMPLGDAGTTPAPRSDEVMRVDPGAAPRPNDPTTGTSPSPMPPDGNVPPETVPPEPTPPAAELPLGRFIPSKGVVLVRLDTDSGKWDRVMPGAALAAGDKLLVLPTYRPTIALSAGLTLQLSSETMLELEASDPSGVPGVKLHFGRFVAMTTGQAGAQLKLTMGQAQGVVTFVNADATLGADVRLFHPFGIDPEKTQAQLSAELYDVSGELTWTPTGGVAISLKAMQRLTVVPHPGTMQQAGSVATISELPSWVSREDIPPILASASPTLADELADEKRPLLLTLHEFADSRRIENRFLGAQCLAMLDQFDPMIDGLNDDRNKAYWLQLIASARNAMTRSPATATRLREAFEQRRGQTAGQQLFRMLGGFTKEQLTADGWANELVKFLDDESLDFRVLAHTNLTEITGRPLNYRPEERSAVNRRPAVNRWKEELKNGRIVPKEPAAAAP